MTRSGFTRAMLFDVEAPDYDEARAFMSPHAALPKIQDPGVKALFEELRNEEVEHQKLVQKQIVKLPPEDDARPDDWVDEPVAHGPRSDVRPRIAARLGSRDRPPPPNSPAARRGGRMPA